MRVNQGKGMSKICNCMNKACERLMSIILPTIGIFLGVLVTTTFVYVMGDIFYQYFLDFWPYHEILKLDTPPKIEHPIDTWAYAVTAVATLAVALIAWFKIENIHKDNEAEFLLRIDERWGNKEIMMARMTIHKLYLYEINNIKRELTRSNKVVVRENIGEKIRLMWKNPKQINEFIHLLHFMDFMETIGYLEKEGHITKEKIDTLCGDSLRFNYKIFANLISNMRDEYEIKELYENFEKLCNKLELSKNNPT